MFQLSVGVGSVLLQGVSLLFCNSLLFFFSSYRHDPIEGILCFYYYNTGMTQQRESFVFIFIIQVWHNRGNSLGGGGFHRTGMTKEGILCSCSYFHRTDMTQQRKYFVLTFIVQAWHNRGNSLFLFSSYRHDTTKATIIFLLCSPQRL